jgi:hypothetical protein
MAIDPEDYAATCARLNDLLHCQIGARGADFAASLRYAGRTLPRAVRQAGARIVDLGAQVENPKLARVTDAEALAQDVAIVERFLNRQNPKTRKARARANMAAGLAFQIAVVIALVIIVLRWRGLI